MLKYGVYVPSKTNPLKQSNDLRGLDQFVKEGIKRRIFNNITGKEVTVGGVSSDMTIKSYTTKTINLDNSYKVTLKRGKLTLTQYIEAVSVDMAEKLAIKTFDSSVKFDCDFNLSNFSKTTQKACKNTLLNGGIRFGFKAGWITLYAKNQSIFEMLDIAKEHQFVNGEGITQIELK